MVFANQGLYNGFLAAGIIFGYAINQISVIYFFLLCDYRRSFWGGYDEE